MNKVTQVQIVASLKTLGVQSGDGLLVHAALQFLGVPDGGVNMYLDALQTVIGSGGTIAVPTFNFAFAKGKDYDPLTTPSVGMGAFSEFVRQQTNALRSTHPMQSLAFIGKDAKEMSIPDTPAAFDEGSAFDRMLKSGYKLLLLGAGIDAAAMFHYVEQRLEVPYRYWKDFSARYLVEEEWQTRTYRMFVRDMQLDPQLTLSSVQKLLESQAQWHTLPLNYGYISVVDLTDFVVATNKILSKDPLGLFSKEPVAKLTKQGQH